MKQAISKKNIWNKTPTSMKYAIGYLLKHIPQDIVFGKSFRQNKKFLKDAEWWSRQQILEYQLSALNSICMLAGRTPYYKKIFSEYGFNHHDITSLSDLSRLPVINRDTINSHLEDMSATPFHSSHVDYITTGGTSGVPLRFYIGASRSSIEYPYIVSSWERIGYKLGIPLAVLRGRVVKKNKSGLFHEYDPLLNHHYYSNFHMNDEDMGRYLNHIRTIGPCYLHVYPSSVATLARFVRRSGLRPPRNILGILTESENVYPEQRLMVEDVFCCRYFSSYGHTEKLVAAAECEKSTNYHVWPTYGYFELLDANDQPVTVPGQRGEIVGTGFINTVVPFIRYRTGDFATYQGERCDKCGREHTIISDIQGHNVQENLVAKDGSLMPWSAVNMHDDTFDNVQQYQFFQDTPGRGILRIIPANSYSDRDRLLILNNLGKKFGDRIEFNVQVVDKIELSKRGKAVFVEQHISY